MGGNAITNARRLPAAEFFAICDEILARATPALPATRIAPVPAYRQKADFGDLDLLVSGSLDQASVRALADALESPEIVSNGPVHSLAYQGFQVDFITVPEASFDFALGYFSWNDLGNLLGRIARAHGLKLGHLGLLYPLRDGTHLFDELVVTQDFCAALDLLRLDPARWTRGFDRLEDVFEYVASTELFDPALFPLEHRSHRARVRDAKRPTYRAFLRWVEREGLSTRSPGRGVDLLAESRQRFPGFCGRLEAARHRLENRIAAARRFNGRIASSLTGLSGPALGRLMAQIRTHFGDRDALDAWACAATDAEISALVLEQASALSEDRAD